MSGRIARQVRVGVVGTGYLGSVHAACMANLGHQVVAVDVDPLRVQALSQCIPPFFEPGLEGLLKHVVPTGRLVFTTNVSALAECEVIFLCVGTPHDVEGRLDTSALFASLRDLARVCDGHTLIVGKSTVPVGTADALAEAYELVSGRRPRLAWNPEFLREGRAIKDTVRPSRLVYGLEHEGSESDEALLDEVYADLLSAGVPKLVTDRTTSELVKGAANAFLATKISFINTVADLCDASGADVVDLARALGLDPRIGPDFLSAGLGFGGGCLPKDIRGFGARAIELGVTEAGELLTVVDKINLARRRQVVDLAESLLDGSLVGKTVGILGFTFKPDSDDLRDSPALAVASELGARGASLRLHDPQGTLPLGYPGSQVATIEQAVHGADIVLHLTEWSEYRGLHPERLGALVKERLLIDARNVFNLTKWRAAGWECRGIGRRAARAALAH